MATKRKRAFDPKEFLARVSNGRTASQYKQKKFVFQQGDPADAVFYIRSGNVKISVLSSQGREAVVALLRDGDFFGEGCLAGQPKRISTAETVTASEIVRLSKKTILKVINDEPRFAELFITHLLNRNIRAEEDLVDQLFNSSEKRLARLLLLLANYGKDRAPATSLTKISQETLAEMVGTTRERVSHFMNKFRRLGLINYNGRIEVYPGLLNLVLHEKPKIQRE